MSNHYEVLGVNANATTEQIEKAYAAKNNENNSNQVELLSAYNVIKNPQSRMQYDNSLIYAKNKGLAKDKLVYIFDFDLTITKYHTAAGTINAQGIAVQDETYYTKLSKDEIEQNVQNVEEFRAFVLQALAQGHGVAIATFSFNHINEADRKAGYFLVKHYLEKIFEEYPGVAEMIPVEAFYPQNQAHYKKLHIDYICKGYDIERDQYTFADDKRENVNLQLRENNKCWLVNHATQRSLLEKFTESLKNPAVLSNPLKAYPCDLDSIIDILMNYSVDLLGPQAEKIASVLPSCIKQACLNERRNKFKRQEEFSFLENDFLSTENGSNNKEYNWVYNKLFSQRMSDDEINVVLMLYSAYVNTDHFIKNLIASIESGKELAIANIAYLIKKFNVQENIIDEIQDYSVGFLEPESLENLQNALKFNYVSFDCLTYFQALKTAISYKKEEFIDYYLAKNLKCDKDIVKDLDENLLGIDFDEFNEEEESLRFKIIKTIITSWFEKDKKLFDKFDLLKSNFSDYLEEYEEYFEEEEISMPEVNRQWIADIKAKMAKVSISDDNNNQVVTAQSFIPESLREAGQTKETNRIGYDGHSNLFPPGDEKNKCSLEEEEQSLNAVNQASTSTFVPKFT